MEIRRLVEQGKQKLDLFKMELGLNPLLVLHYLEKEEKEPLVGAFPVIDFDRAVVGMATMRGKDRIEMFRRFLGSYVDLRNEQGEIFKNVKLLSFEYKVNEEESDFWVVFVSQVLGGELLASNISYLDYFEIDMWEDAAAGYLRHRTGGMTVIKG